MPYLGLILTSVGFVIPSIIAWRRRHRFDAISSGILTVTSIAYHSSLHPVIQKIDMVVAHTLGLVSVPRSIRHWITWKHSKVKALVVFGTLGSIGIYWFKSKSNPYHDSKYWHMLFHLMCQTTWLTHLCATPSSTS
jgi:hypothetical protein